MAEFEDELDNALAKIRQILPIALVKGAEHIRGASAELTPVESGHLVGSAEVKLNSETEAQVYYPGPYARYQHYELQLRHTHGQALYLEQPMVTEAQTVLDIISDEIRSVL